MHLGQCLAGTTLVKDGDARWDTPCKNGAGGNLIIDIGHDVGVVVPLCAWHYGLYRSENMFTNIE